MTVDNLLHLANNSGGVLYVIAAMLFVALTIIIERSWFLQRAASASHAVLDRIDRLEALNAGALTACAEQFQALPMASLLKAAGRLAGQTSTREELDACLDEAIMREAPNIDRLLWVLDTIVTLAPLLGLFGTIVGMFNAFQVLSNPGNAPTQVTGGVAEALIATASGLFVAMIGLVFFNGLHNRVRSVVHQLETVKAALVNRLAARTHDAAKAVHEVPRPVVGKFASQGV
ncbi:MotA/TolQ/ExbB proton channel family protein [Paraburkholderia sp. HD33-4]|uniref:MotA/TolQ/ExbB proton channel family protein n=1 Tax=Paraburkholderia sp. HD33-4 TaxID=2883242 RepID=UPI001F25A937|nr:MotA/TolQ/ExbB proton channel family protein [Paraburkholderia sp. HD33-4]